MGKTGQINGSRIREIFLDTKPSLARSAIVDKFVDLSKACPTITEEDIANHARRLADEDRKRRKRTAGLAQH